MVAARVIEEAGQLVQEKLHPVSLAEEGVKAPVSCETKAVAGLRMAAVEVQGEGEPSPDCPEQPAAAAEGQTAGPLPEGHHAAQVHPRPPRTPESQEGHL